MLYNLFINMCYLVGIVFGVLVVMAILALILCLIMGTISVIKGEKK